MTDEEIHNIYLHMSGKAEGLVEATGTADFPVMFARAILEYDRRTKDAQNMASKFTYKEQLETKDEPVAWGMETDGLIYDVICPAEHEREEGEYTIPLYTTPQRKPLTDEQIWDAYIAYVNAPVDIDCHVSDLHKFARAIEAAHGIKELA